MFDDSLRPLDEAGRLDKPHGLDRLEQSEAFHAEDFARLHIDEKKEVRITTNTKTTDTFVRSAREFVTACAERGCEWDEIEKLVDAGCSLAGVTLAADERMELYETWDAIRFRDEAA